MWVGRRRDVENTELLGQFTRIYLEGHMIFDAGNVEQSRPSVLEHRRIIGLNLFGQDLMVRETITPREETTHKVELDICTILKEVYNNTVRLV